MSDMQTLVAETLNMERGVSKDETDLEHLEHNDYIIQKQIEKLWVEMLFIVAFLVKKS